MKRKVLIRHLSAAGCIFLREGAKQSVFFNPANNKISTVPRHSEVDDFLVKKIGKDLGIMIL